MLYLLSPKFMKNHYSYYNVENEKKKYRKKQSWINKFCFNQKQPKKKKKLFVKKVTHIRHIFSEVAFPYTHDAHVLFFSLCDALYKIDDS